MWDWESRRDTPSGSTVCIYNPYSADGGLPAGAVGLLVSQTGLVGREGNCVQREQREQRVQRAQADSNDIRKHRRSTREIQTHGEGHSCQPRPRPSSTAERMLESLTGLASRKCQAGNLKSDADTPLICVTEAKGSSTTMISIERLIDCYQLFLTTHIMSTRLRLRHPCSSTDAGGLTFAGE